MEEDFCYVRFVNKRGEKGKGEFRYGEEEEGERERVYYGVSLWGGVMVEKVVCVGVLCCIANRAK